MARLDGPTDEERFIWLFRTEYARVVRTTKMILRDQEAAAEVAQDAFLRLYVHFKKVSRYERPDLWVQRVAIRAAGRRAWRDRRREVLERDLDRPPDHHAGRDPDIERSIHALPMRQRAVVLLFYFQDRPVDEIAEILQCSPSTVKVHLHRARKRLAQMLGEEIVDVS